jgi:hypothetical protein
LEFAVEVAKLDIAQEGVSHDSEAGEEDEEDKAVPELKAPANGLKDHSEPPTQ